MAAIRNAIPATKQIVDNTFSNDMVTILFLIQIAISASLKITPNT